MQMHTLRDIVRTLLTSRYSNRRIAALYQVSPNTVRTYRKRLVQLNISWSVLQVLDDDVLRRTLWPETNSISLHPVPDWPQVHKQMQVRHQTLLQLWEEYRLNHRYKAYSYSQFTHLYRQFVAHLDISMRQTHFAGEAIYIDFAGDTLNWTDPNTGQEHHAQIYVAVLGCSQYTFACACESQQLEHWIDAHNRMFMFYGGVAQVLIPDNLKSAVTRPGFDVQLNRTYQEMSQHYGCTIVPARVRRPKDKSLAEIGVLLITRWIIVVLKRRCFFSVAEINEAIVPLLEAFNLRPFKRLPGCRRSRFLELDKPALQPLPSEPYTFARWLATQKVPTDYHVYIYQHAYSVPYQLVSEKVEAKVTHNTVAFYHKNRQVALHMRSADVGGCTTDSNHRPASHRAYAEQHFTQFEQWASSVGSYTTAWVKAQFTGRAAHSIAGNRACSQLQQLAKQYGVSRTEAACQCACQINSFSISSVRSILQCHLDQQPVEQPMCDTTLPIHSNVRGSSYYQSEAR